MHQYDFEGRHHFRGRRWVYGATGQPAIPFQGGVPVDWVYVEAINVEIAPKDDQMWFWV
jgi:hypothetical protein